MNRFVIVVCMILCSGDILGQVHATYYHDCKVDHTHINFYTTAGHDPTRPAVGDSFDIIITPTTECHRAVEFLIDFKSYNVADQIVIYEDSVLTFESHWIGDPQHWIHNVPVLAGYAEYDEHQLILSNGRFSDIPGDFHNGFLVSSPHPMGMFRIRFTSDADQIILRTRSHPRLTSAMSVYVHCDSEAFERTKKTYLAEYICHDPVAESEVIDNDDCENIIIVDSINVSDSMVWDTICVYEGTVVNLEIDDPHVAWENGRTPTFVAHKTFNYYGKAVNYYGCVFDYNFHIIVLSKDVFFPNAFTPNGDGVNDVFEGYTGQGTIVKNIKIFDRWGALVYEGLSWDGGRYMPGVYTYVAEIQYKKIDGTDIIAGDVTLIK